MFEWLYAYVIDVGTVLISMPINLTEKFYVVHLATFVALAFFSYRYYDNGSNGANGSVYAFLKFLFPKKIYAHSSARIDYGIFLINVLISPLVLVGVWLRAFVATKVAEALIALNGGDPVFIGDWTALTFSFFILGFTMAADFAVYLVHRFHHQSDIFWPLHALHHSAEVMTPVTLFRKHPVWNLLASGMNMLLTGIFQGLFLFVFFGRQSVEVLFGINTIYVLYNFFGANLRHSHVWLSWGKPLSHLFISPAMHQIHHDPNRMNKNYGEIFAIWDWLFGTLYVPERRERFAIGLGEANPHTTLARAYYVPLTGMYRQIVRKVRSTAKRV